MLRLQINGGWPLLLIQYSLVSSPLNSRQQMSETWELSLLLIERHGIILSPMHNWKLEFRQNYRTTFSPTVPSFAARIPRVVADVQAPDGESGNV